MPTFSQRPEKVTRFVAFDNLSCQGGLERRQIQQQICQVGNTGRNMFVAFKNNVATTIKGFF